MSRTTKSATEFAKVTLETAQLVLPDYSSPFSPKKFTQPQLLTMLALRQFFKLDYRGTVARLAEWKELREVLQIERVPEFTTLIHAEKRLLKKGSSLSCSPAASSVHAKRAC
jgi:hypothetical protein